MLHSTFSYQHGVLKMTVVLLLVKSIVYLALMRIW